MTDLLKGETHSECGVPKTCYCVIGSRLSSPLQMHNAIQEFIEVKRHRTGKPLDASDLINKDKVTWFLCHSTVLHLEVSRGNKFQSHFWNIKYLLTLENHAKAYSCKLIYGLNSVFIVFFLIDCEYLNLTGIFCLKENQTLYFHVARINWNWAVSMSSVPRIPIWHPWYIYVNCWSTKHLTWQTLSWSHSTAYTGRNQLTKNL